MKINIVTGSIGAFFAFCTFAVMMIGMMAVWTDRTLEFWASYMQGTAVEIPYWISLLTTIVLNGGILAANILSELFRLII